MVKPYIGILIEPFTYRGIQSGDTGREHLAFYEKGGAKYGAKPCYFRLSDIQFERGKVTAYIENEGRYQLQTIPIPKVIHNRVMLKAKKDQVRMSRLKKMNCILFNSRNRFSKWHIHKLLEQNAAFRSYLPTTYKATSKTIYKMMRNHDQLIIKPENGSIGKGILKLERTGSEWQLSYMVPVGMDRFTWVTETFQHELPAILLQKIKRGAHLVQEKIPLACYEDAPFDMRVSVQRNHEGKWQVTAIVAKVARKGHFLTNVARGGSTYPLSYILQKHPTLQYDQVKRSVERFALEIASYLGKRLHHLADIGLDIGITDDGKLYFIECNGRDLRVTFRNAKMMDEWEQTHTTPIGYGAYLLRRNLGN